MPNSNGIVQTNPMNKTHGKHNHNYSSFPDSLSYRNHLTCRFGDYTPTFVCEGVPKDEISILANHRVDSLSLNAPFKGQIRKITESFCVPNMAILPRNWDLIYTQPSNGDDVPKDSNCVIKNWPQMVSGRFMFGYSRIRNAINALTEESTSEDVRKVLTAFLRFFVTFENFYSHGALVNVLGYKMSNQFEIIVDGKYRSYDYWFDAVLSRIFSHFDDVQIKVPQGGSYSVRYFRCLSGTIPGEFGATKFGSFRSLLELFRENPVCWVDRYTSQETTAEIVQDFVSLQVYPNEYYPLLPDPETPNAIMFHLPEPYVPEADDLTDMSQSNFNLSRLLAYQIICAHYYSNSSVDVVYSAELFRQYVRSLALRSTFVDEDDFVFSLNGYDHEYDILSGHILELAFGLKDPADVFSFFYLSALSDADQLSSLALISVVFGFRKSLRFGDYFVGSRPRPLAPINTDVAVNNNLVSVIDVTRSIQAQRFGNAVMRSRQKIENYVADLFGKAPAPDYHNPFYLTREAEIVFGDEVQNTAESQVVDPNSRTANFKNADQRFRFTFHNDDAHPCIYMQIVSFDVKRAYSRSVDRQFFHLDRFDMFNPDFQYIGDQPVYGYELGYTNDGEHIPAVFSYQGRDMEYKQRFDVCSGGFVENLPGWILTDRDQSVFSLGVLDPDFIRSYNTELDQFFLALNGFSLGSYFHFIVSCINDVSAKRPMAVDPQILG